MTEIERDNKPVEKLVQVTDPLSLEGMTSKGTCTKKRTRRIADPHIEPRKKNGNVYYYFRRGTDPPIYLGTAVLILKAVRGRGK